MHLLKMVKGVTADIYSDGEHKNLRDMHNAGKGKQPVNTHKWSKSSHDRWVIIDDWAIYSKKVWKFNEKCYKMVVLREKNLRMS